jgi:hypothetical protein
MKSSCKYGGFRGHAIKEVNVARREGPDTANRGDRSVEGYIGRLWRKDPVAIGRLLLALLDAENNEENRELRREAARARARQRRRLRRAVDRGYAVKYK